MGSCVAEVDQLPFDSRITSSFPAIPTFGYGGTLWLNIAPKTLHPTWLLVIGVGAMHGSRAPTSVEMCVYVGERALTL